MKTKDLWTMTFLSLVLLWVSSVRATDTERPSLKDVFAEHFLIGGALNRMQITRKDPNATALVEKHFKLSLLKTFINGVRFI